jgi:hypothetical protein
MVFKLLSVLILMIVPTLGRHDFYISVCYIKEVDKQLQVTYRLFMDDAVSAIGDIQIENEFCEQISSYIQSKFRIMEDHRSLHLNLNSCSMEGDGRFETVSCIMTSEDHFSDAAAMTIESTVLLEVYDDQVNMIHVQMEATKKSMNLDRDRKTFEVILH